MQEFDGLDAWKHLISSPDATWEQIVPRFDESTFVVSIEPKFELDRTMTFFCLGSCFARNIEEHLLYRGIDVLSMGIVSPKAERSARPNGLVNKFTTNSMSQEVAWVLDPFPRTEDLFVEIQNGWEDLHIAGSTAPVSLERCIERRAYLQREYFSRLRDADVVIVTLGLNEVWLDTRTGLYFNRAPAFFTVRKNPERFRLAVTDASENERELEKLYALLKGLNPGVRLIVTVSPVPMTGTFSGRDVAVANTLSKAVLRAAADAFCSAHDDAEYFPSYEMIALAPRHVTYRDDCLHVSDAAVGRAVAAFLKAYLGGAERVCPESFVEMNYLLANPDVEEAVRAGDCRSGFDHWLAYGRDEGRPLAVSR